MTIDIDNGEGKCIGIGIDMAKNIGIDIIIGIGIDMGIDIGIGIDRQA